jgi:putative sigma-54 modulation protein
MKIQTLARKVPLTPTLRAFVNRQVADILQRFLLSISSVQVDLRDRNGRRGGGDKRCRIRVLLAAGVPVVAEEENASIRQAVRQAAARAASGVRAALRRL